MITIHNEGAKQLIGLLEWVVESGQAPPEEAIGRVLSSEALSFMTEAYSKMLDFSKEEFVRVLINLANPEPVGVGTVVSKLEEGFRSCLSREKIALLRKKLKKISQIDFTEAEHTALTYLPSETIIESNIYLTIDSFNPGMIYEGNIGLSLLAADPEKVDLRLMAHEFHHVGFQYWTDRNSKLSGKRITEDYEGIAVKLVLALISEGLANYFCTPNMIYREVESKGYERIKEYERNLNPLLEEIWSLLSDCVSKTAPIETCKERLEKIVFDTECILPPIHYIGARTIEMFEKHSAIERTEIINLCKQPSQFFVLYQKIAAEYNLPTFPEEVAQQISRIL